MTVRYMPDGLRRFMSVAQLHTRLPRQLPVHTRRCIDAAVAQLLLAVIEPAQLTIAWRHRASRAQARAIDHQWHLRIERARYEAERARRRYEGSGAGISLSGP